MIYKIPYATWKNSLEVGEEVHDVDDIEVKIVSIIKIVSYGGDTFVYVQGVRPEEIDY